MSDIMRRRMLVMAAADLLQPGYLYVRSISLIGRVRRPVSDMFGSMAVTFKNGVILGRSTASMVFAVGL